MKEKQFYNVEPKPFVLTLNSFHTLYTKGRRLFHWFSVDEVNLVNMLMNPNYHFFWLMSNNQPLGIVWVYDITGESARCGAAIWGRISNWADLVTQCFNVFKVNFLVAVVDKENNQLSKRLLTKLGFKEEDKLWVVHRQVLQKTH